MSWSNSTRCYIIKATVSVLQLRDCEAIPQSCPGHHHPLETTETVTMAGGETLWMTETGIVIVIGETTEEITEEMTDGTETITVGTEDREG